MTTPTIAQALQFSSAKAVRAHVMKAAHAAAKEAHAGNLYGTSYSTLFADHLQREWKRVKKQAQAKIFADIRAKFGFKNGGARHEAKRLGLYWDGSAWVGRITYAAAKQFAAWGKQNGCDMVVSNVSL